MFKKFVYPVFDYLFEHPKASMVMYYTLVLMLVFFAWPLLEPEPWRFASAMLVVALLHIVGLIDGSRTTFDALEK